LTVLHLASPCTAVRRTTSAGAYRRYRRSLAYTTPSILPQPPPQQIHRRGAAPLGGFDARPKSDRGFPFPNTTTPPPNRIQSNPIESPLRPPRRRAAMPLPTMTHSSSFLRLPATSSPHPPPADDASAAYAVVVLNQRLPRFAPLLWDRARLRVCADGGANRVFDGMPELLPAEDPDQVRMR
jgi:hypothetical protein